MTFLLALVFLTTEAIRIPVGSSGPAAWKATSYFGAVTQGTAQVSSGEAALPPHPPGYYDLEIGGETTSFVVMTPVSMNADSPFGVHTHFPQGHDLAILPLLKKAGIVHIRDEQQWSWVEQEQGVYEFPHEDYMIAAQPLGIEPFIDLTFSNPFYDYDEGDFTFPYSASGRAGFVNYARAVLNRYGNQIRAVEVWNEPGYPHFAKGPATAWIPDYYTPLLKEVQMAVKQLRPDVKVVAGATFPIQHGFFRELFERDGLSYMDAASIHPYGVNETLPLMVSELRNLMSQFGPVKPIWCTEYSYGATDNSKAQRRKAATDNAEQVAMMLSAGIERMYFYLAQDDGVSPFRGLLGRHGESFRPHPALAAYATCIRQLGGKTFAGRLPTSLSVYALRFGDTVALWSQFPATVNLTTTGSLSAVRIDGSALSLNPAAVQISDDPIYITGNISAITELSNPVIADSRSGYSKTQGGNGWSYGFADLGSGDTYSLADFRPMEWRIWRLDNYRWVVPGRDSPFAEQDGMHPQDGTWAIRRWTSNASGLVTLFGRIQLDGGGDGVDIRMFVDGHEIHSEFLGPSESREYNISNVRVQVGSRVDFAITSHGHAVNDATVHTSTVLRSTSGVPDPPTNLHITSP